MEKFFGNIIAGSTVVSIPIVLRKTADSTETTGVTVSGALIASYWRQGQFRVGITLSALGAVDSAWSAGGWFEVDSTNMPGVYRLDVPNEVVTYNNDWTVVSVKYTNSFVFYERFNLETELLDKNLNDGIDQGSPTRRTVRQGVRALRNKVAVTSSTVTVYKEDDATSSWTATVSTDATASPITTIDPA